MGLRAPAEAAAVWLRTGAGQAFHGALGLRSSQRGRCHQFSIRKRRSDPETVRPAKRSIDMALTLTSDNFKEGDILGPQQVLSEEYGFGCAGGNLSPQLAW